MGLLAAGSGSTAMSAALADSASATADFRVITAGQLTAQAGEAFADDGSVREGTRTTPDGDFDYEDKYIAYESASSFFQSGDGLDEIDSEEIPVATVIPRDEGTNEELDIETALSLEEDILRFPDILSVENTTGEDFEIGIGYDRDADQYGDDVDEDGEIFEDVTPNLVQHIYQFRAGSDPENKCSIENAVLEYDHSVLASFLMLLSAKSRTISRNCRYQNRERRPESCVRLVVEYDVSAIHRCP